MIFSLTDVRLTGRIFDRKAARLVPEVRDCLNYAGGASRILLDFEIVMKLHDTGAYGRNNI